MLVRFACLSTALGCIAATCLSAEKVPSPPRKHLVERVVLEPDRATITHRLPVRPGETLTFDTNVADVDADFQVLLVEPADEIRVEKPQERIQRSPARRYSKALKLGVGDDFDFDVEELRKWLLGREVTLVVAADKAMAEMSGSLTAGEEKPTRLDGSVTTYRKEEREITGPLLGFSTDSAGKRTVKILDDNRNLTEIPEDAIRCFDVGEHFSKALLGAVPSATRASASDRWQLTVTRVRQEGEDGSDGDRCQVEPRIVYSVPVTDPWKIQLQGQLGDEGETLCVRGWARIANDTPHEWSDTLVVLRTERADYLLRNVSLDPGEAASFPLSFGVRSGSGTDSSTPVDAIELAVSRRNEVLVPDSDPVTHRELVCYDTLILQNKGLHTVPAGVLTVCAGRKRLASAAIDEIPPVDKNKTRFRLAQIAGFAALYSKSKSEGIVQVERIDGHVITVRSGYAMKFRFRCDDCRYSRIRLSEREMTIDCEPGMPCFESDIGNRNSDDILPLYLTFYKTASDRTFSRPYEDENALVICDISRASEQRNGAEMSSSQLTNLGELPLVDGAVASAIASLAAMRAAVEKLEATEERQQRQIESLEKRVRAAAGAASSAYQGPALRRLDAEIQDHERRLAVTRDHLTIAEFRFDCLARGLSVPSAP